MAQVVLVRLGCPQCGARVPAAVDICADCGYRLLEDSAPTARSRAAIRTGRQGVRVVALAGGVLAAVGAAVLLMGQDGEAGGRKVDHRGVASVGRTDSEVVSIRPLSARAAERRLEARFAAPRDDDSTVVRCSALLPRPAHSIRHCRIRYPTGSQRSVVLLLDPRGHERLIQP